MMADAMETLEIEVKHKASGATDEIDKLTNALLRLNRILAGTTIPKLHSLADALKRVTDVQSKMEKATGRNSGKGKKETPFTNFSDEQREEIRNMEKYEVAWVKFQKKRFELEDAFNNGDAYGAIKAQDAVIKAQESYNKAYWDKFGNDEEGEERVSTWERISNALSNVQSRLRAVGSGIDDITKRSKRSEGTISKMLNSFKRIAVYRMLRKVINEISKAAQEGLQNAYTFSQMIGSSISQTMDSLTSLSLTMKNQIGAALGELLTTIRPILEYIIQLVTRIADAIAQFFAILGGRSVYHKATGATKQWAAATQSGADAAKEWKNQLMGFDEINRLEAPSDTGGGGGGGGADVGNWELSPVTLDFSWLDKYKEVTKEWAENLDFTPMINAWEALKKRLSEFAKLVDTAVFWAYTNVLLPFGKWVVEKAAPASVELLASAFNFLNAVLEKVGPVFSWLWNTYLKPIAVWIGDAFIVAINWLREAFDGLAEKIRNANSFGEFLQSLNGKETILLGVATAIVAVVTAMAAFNTVNSIIKTFGGVVSLLSNPIGIAIVAITGLVIAGIALYQNWDSIVAGIKDLWDKMSNAAKTAFNFVANLVKSIGDKISTSVNNVSDKVHDGITRMKDNVTNTFNGIRSTIANIITQIRGLFDFSWSLPRPRIPHIGWTWDWMEAAGISIPIPNFKLEWYANGGFPDEDGLFMANHNELIGQFTNGKTAVANNEQIIAGIKQGVMEAMMTVMGSQGGNGNNRNTEFVFELNGREFARAIYNDTRAVAREHGGSLINT
jgi:gas vesicle protein